MQQNQIQNFRMMPVFCDKVTHQGEVVRGLCLTPMCKEKSSICFHCYDAHRQCQFVLKDLEGVPIKLLELQQLKKDIIVLQGNINEQFKELLSIIELRLSPIAKYYDAPNLTNLNEIGSLLKGYTQISILNALDQTKIQIQTLLGNFEFSDDQFWSEQGYELNKQKQYNKAIFCLDKAIQQNPNDETNWSQKGYALYMLDQFNRAADCYGKAILLNPKDSQLYYSKGIFYSGSIQGEALLMSNKVDEACACYEKSIQLNRNDPNILLEITLSLFILSKFKEANYCYYKAIQFNPKAALLSQLKIFPLSTKAKSKEEYLEKFKQTVKAWQEKGMALYDQGKKKEAIDCYDKAIELDSKHIDSWYWKGRALRVQDYFKEAIDCYDKAIELDPKHIDSWYQKGWALYDQGKKKEAIDCYDKAIELDSKHIDSWYWKGRALYDQGKKKEAIDCYDKAIELDSKHIDSWYWKGRALYWSSKYKEAIQCCEDALKYLPNNSTIQDLLSNLKKRFQESQNIINEGMLK